MGNKCCPASSSTGRKDSHLEVTQPQPFPSKNSNKMASASRAEAIYQTTTPSSSSASLSPSQRKLTEFLQITAESQSANLVNMREQLKKKPDLFVLNNLVLSIQFLENFDRSVISRISTCSS